MNGDKKDRKKRREDRPSEDTVPAEHSIDRRRFLTGLPLIAGGVLASPLILSSNGEAAPTRIAEKNRKEETTLPDFRISLVKQRGNCLVARRERLAPGSFPYRKALQVY